MKMNRRVYGVVAIKSIMSNWNADMTGNPKSVLSGVLFGSDKAFKYPIKRMWQYQGEKVLYIKSYKIDEKEDKGKLQPKDLNERYEELFSKLDEKTPSKEVLKNLFLAIDVMNFGATFAVKKQNIGITGAVQVGQGYNKYKDTDLEVIDILSPFRNSNEKSEDAQASSMGKKIVTQEAHYVYPFSVNPQNYNDYVQLGIDGFEGYTEEAFEKFKAGCLVAATAFNTNSKSGCENEFALFLYCKPDSSLYLANIDGYIDFSKEGGKSVIDATRLKEHLGDSFSEIEKIEVYFNKSEVDFVSGGLDCTVNSLY
ncbi:MAG TPA: CRISPR-associated protein [Ruminiclostridium sp.]|jgi:CRISPR-associated protein Csh2|nr:CRISPR-associated protein [Ruminiclostridium sp.]